MDGISNNGEERAIEMYLLQMLTATWGATQRVVFLPQGHWSRIPLFTREKLLT